MRHFYTLLPLSLGMAAPALAQLPPTAADSLPPAYRHRSHCHCCCHCRHGATATTEYSNRTAFLMGMGITSDQSSRAYVGFGLEVGRAVGPRLTVGGRGWMSVARNSASNYGYDATAPALAIHSLAGAVRYQLLNARRWRLEAVGSLGVGAVQLYDRDQTVVSYGRYERSEHAATVFVGVHPLVEGGTGISCKVGRQFWLSSRLGYQYLPSTGRLGAAGEFSGWQASLYATAPWGRH